jgi:hypothetical protein
MGLRGPGARPLNRHPPSRTSIRRQKHFERLRQLAYGTGLTVEQSAGGNAAICGSFRRIESVLLAEREHRILR